MFNSVKLNPNLTRHAFLVGIIKSWLDLYRNREHKEILSKNDVVLKNNLKHAIAISGKTQAQISRETGISRPHLSQIIAGRYDFSVKMALLLAESLNYPPEKFTEFHGAIKNIEKG